MAELTDAQKVMRNDTGKSIAEAIANMSITVAGQEIEVSDTEPQSKFVDVWFQEQQQGTPVEVYTVPEIDGMIATAETSPSAAAHHVGEYIIYDAKLYKVVAEISPGNTLNPTQGSGNIEAITVCSAFGETFQSTLTDLIGGSGSVVTNTLLKAGRTVSLSYRKNIPNGISGANNVALLPSGFRPKISGQQIFARTLSGSTQAMTTVGINTDGNVTIYTNDTITDVMIFGTYIL